MNAMSKDPLTAFDATAHRMIVGIATAARPGVLEETVRRLQDQTRLPDAVYISAADPAHLGDVQSLDVPFDIVVVRSAQGSCCQRNAILKQMRASDLLLFIDDDFILAPDYLQRLEALFLSHPDIIQITGNVVADGILGRGFDHKTGAELLSQSLKAPAGTALVPVANAYGCNMAMRVAPLFAMDLFFDERLPHYGWLEDLDFSMRLHHLGRVVRAEELRGVHLGTKRGRTPGKRLGYSQVANPVYLMRKGTLPRKRGLRIMARNLSANLVRTVKPQSWVDHRGRLLGNLTGFWDLLLGRIDPERSI